MEGVGCGVTCFRFLHSIPFHSIPSNCAPSNVEEKIPLLRGDVVVRDGRDSSVVASEEAVVTATHIGDVVAVVETLAHVCHHGKEVVQRARVYARLGVDGRGCACAVIRLTCLHGAKRGCARARERGGHTARHFGLRELFGACVELVGRQVERRERELDVRLDLGSSGLRHLATPERAVRAAQQVVTEALEVQREHERQLRDTQLLLRRVRAAAAAAREPLQSLGPREA